MQRRKEKEAIGYTDLGGRYEVQLNDGSRHHVILPGTLDENHVGGPDSPEHQWKAELIQNRRITTRLTRKAVYEGNAVYCRQLYLDILPAERAFVEMERSRKQGILINGKTPDTVYPGTVSTPAVYEATELLHRGNNEIRLNCDNAYTGWPHDAIVYSSAATDETQTNWNGFVGIMRIRWERNNFIRAIRVYPGTTGARVEIEVDARTSGSGVLKIVSAAFDKTYMQNVSFESGITCFTFADLPYCDTVRRWDEYEGNLYKISAVIDEMEQKSDTFGIRVFDGDGGVLRNNGHRIFLRGEANCCVFPEKGHMPVKKREWKKILKRYQAYGVNCLRFHSHCPPEAAFAAADEEGIFVQPELSHWNPKDAFEQEQSREYYRMELREILRAYANHPSFVMLSFGNELSMGNEGERYMHVLLNTARELDASRLYAGASNPFYGAHGADCSSDFYTSSNYGKEMLRGTSAGMEGAVNHLRPASDHDYVITLEHLRKEYAGPVFSFEVGQYEILPDFSEIRQFRGVTRPDNLRAIRESVRKSDQPRWQSMVEATGELALQCYREEVEAVLRTPQMSGISLLGIQDFPGQGTALVGMLNSHLQIKPYPFAAPHRFRKFFTPVLPLASFAKYTFEGGETFQAVLRMANYGKNQLTGNVVWKLTDGQNVQREGKCGEVICPAGELTSIGNVKLTLPETGNAVCYTLQILYENKNHMIFNNEYQIWSYPHLESVQPEKGKVLRSGNVFITRSPEDAFRLLQNGDTVFLSPQALKENFAGSAAGAFSTDFWSVGIFPEQEGYMGFILNEKHPIFADFPTRAWPQWQWWSITTESRSMRIPEKIDPLIQVIDCYARHRKLAFLFECRVGSGRLIVSSMGLLEKQEYPEARSLLHGILDYMNSERFCPETALTQAELAAVL